VSEFLPAVPLTDIAESPFNPRRLFHGPAMTELADSIREKGVLSPVLLRPLSGVAADNALAVYELVFGHRRFRAAKLAGLTEIPALVQEMSDAEALERQVVENGQRADMTPVEEAEGYLALHRKHGLRVAEIAQKVGKSETHVYQRMQLGELPEQAIHAVASGDLALSVALALARMPNPALRTKAAAEVLEQKTRTVWDGAAGESVEITESMSTEAALRHIRTRYSLRMEEATWDLADADLVPSAGSCAKCPKRSRNMGCLFPELTDAHDLCLDPDCHASKKEAAWQKRKSDLEASGRDVLDGKAAEKDVHEWGAVPSSGYVEATTVCHDDPKSRTWAQVLGRRAEGLPVARDSSGKEHILVPAELVAEKKKELAAKRKADPKEVEQDEEDAAAEFESEVLHRTASFTVARVVQQAEQVDADQEQLWRQAAELLLLLVEDRIGAQALQHTALSRGLISGEHDEDESIRVLRQSLRTSLTPAQVRGLAVEMLAELAHCYETWGGEGPDNLKALAESFDVDAKKEAKAARRAVEAERKEEAAAAAKKAAKKSGGLTIDDFELGEIVTYREGRGRFKATVVRRDLTGDLIGLCRDADGKRVERPVTKVEKGWVA
jgi:ParB/RepB/Spo0J family partition protein